MELREFSFSQVRIGLDLGVFRSSSRLPLCVSFFDYFFFKRRFKMDFQLLFFFFKCKIVVLWFGLCADLIFVAHFTYILPVQIKL